MRFSSVIASFVMLTFLAFSVSPTVVAQGSTGTTTDGAGNCVDALGVGSEGDACISVVHASPDAPNVDIYLDGQHVLGNLGFGWWSNWVAVPAGDHQVQVTAAGASLDTAVIDATVTVDAGMGYQIAATGFVAEITPQIYPIDFSALDEGNGRINVVHAVPDAPAVDVAVAGGDVLISNLAFPDASEALEVPAGTYDLEVRPAGTEDVALDLPGVTLEAGMAYDVFAVGLLEDGSLNVLVVPSTTGATSAS